MELLKQKTDLELIKSILVESAKASNELACARRDIDKAVNRQNFILVLINELQTRQQD